MCPLFQPTIFISRLYIRPPCIVHDKRYWHLLWFQVAHVDNPDAVDAALVCKVQLLAEFRHGSGVYPTVIPRATVHVNVVVQAQSTLTLAFCCRSLAAYIAPVVVAEQQGHVIGHGEASIVVALHLSEDSPQLRNGIRPSVDVLDNLALTVDDVPQRLHILLVITLTHSHIAVAAHTDGHEIIIIPVALHALAKKGIHALLVRGIVPWADLLLAVQVFTM